MQFGPTIISYLGKCLGRRSLYRFNKALYFTSLKALGIGNWKDAEISGEKHFLQQFCSFVNSPVIFDIGANIGDYSRMVKAFSPNATIYSFEPHPRTFSKLEISAAESNYNAFNVALSDRAGRAKLFDHKQDEFSETGSQQASLLQGVIREVHSNDDVSWEVELDTFDAFVEEHDIRKVDLIKIDVEGSELNVLQGAKNSLENRIIDFIQFEFTEASIVSRVFMKDFVRILDDFDFFRMLPDGLVSLGPYYPPLFEIFAYQNILAARKSVDRWWS